MKTQLGFSIAAQSMSYIAHKGVENMKIFNLSNAPQPPLKIRGGRGSYDFVGGEGELQDGRFRRLTKEMGVIKVIFGSIFLLFIFLSQASSEIYKWKDSNGNTIYSDSPPSEVDAQKMRYRENKIERPEIKENKTKLKNEKSDDKKSYNDIKIIMYMTSWCPYCRKAREYINSLGVNLAEYDIDKDKNKRTEMLTKSGGSKGVPLIDVEGIIIRGYVPDAIKKAIEKRRNL